MPKLDLANWLIGSIDYVPEGEQLLVGSLRNNLVNQFVSLQESGQYPRLELTSAGYRLPEAKCSQAQRRGEFAIQRLLLNKISDAVTGILAGDLDAFRQFQRQVQSAPAANKHGQNLVGQGQFSAADLDMSLLAKQHKLLSIRQQNLLGVTEATPLTIQGNIQGNIQGLESNPELEQPSFSVLASGAKTQASQQHGSIFGPSKLEQAKALRKDLPYPFLVNPIFQDYALHPEQAKELGRTLPQIWQSDIANFRGEDPQWRPHGYLKDYSLEASLAYQKQRLEQYHSQIAQVKAGQVNNQRHPALADYEWFEKNLPIQGQEFRVTKIDTELKKHSSPVGRLLSEIKAFQALVLASADKHARVNYASPRAQLRSARQLLNQQLYAGLDATLPKLAPKLDSLYQTQTTPKLDQANRPATSIFGAGGFASLASAENTLAPGQKSHSPSQEVASLATENKVNPDAAEATGAEAGAAYRTALARGLTRLNELYFPQESAQVPDDGTLVVSKSAAESEPKAKTEADQDIASSNPFDASSPTDSANTAESPSNHVESSGFNSGFNSSLNSSLNSDFSSGFGSGFGASSSSQWEQRDLYGRVIAQSTPLEVEEALTQVSIGFNGGLAAYDWLANQANALNAFNQLDAHAARYILDPVVLNVTGKLKSNRELKPIYLQQGQGAFAQVVSGLASAEAGTKLDFKEANLNWDAINRLNKTQAEKTYQTDIFKTALSLKQSTAPKLELEHWFTEAPKPNSVGLHVLISVIEKQPALLPKAAQTVLSPTISITDAFKPTPSKDKATLQLERALEASNQGEEVSLTDLPVLHTPNQALTPNPEQYPEQTPGSSPEQKSQQTPDSSPEQKSQQTPDSSPAQKPQQSPERAKELALNQATSGPEVQASSQWGQFSRSIPTTDWAQAAQTNFTNTASRVEFPTSLAQQTTSAKSVDWSSVTSSTNSASAAGLKAATLDNVAQWQNQNTNPSLSAASWTTASSWQANSTHATLQQAVIPQAQTQAQTQAQHSQQAQTHPGAQYSQATQAQAQLTPYPQESLQQQQASAWKHASFSSDATRDLTAVSAATVNAASSWGNQQAQSTQASAWSSSSAQTSHLWQSSQTPQAAQAQASQQYSYAFTDARGNHIYRYLDQWGNTLYGFSQNNQWYWGFYDPRGNWITGYYQGTRWISGGYDAQGKWFSGYYDANWNWINT